MSQEKIALLGFGDIASRLVPHLKGYDIIGMARSKKSYPGITLQTVNCSDQASVNQNFRQKFDVIVMTFTPSEASDHGYKTSYVDSMQAVLNALHQYKQTPRLVIFVSSTSVYGQHDGSWIDEDSPAHPTRYSGRRLLEAEQLLKNSSFSHCCVRFSGIYGPGRKYLINQVIAGNGSPEKPKQYTNRIHAEDCAGVLAHIIRQPTNTIESCYIASDCEPTPLYDIKQWIAQQLALPNHHLSHTATATKKQTGSKRCSNQRLLSSGYQFRYPSYKEGYTELLKSQS